MTRAPYFTARAEKAFDMLEQAELVPLDWWERRPFTWLTVPIAEFQGLMPGRLWEWCEGAVHHEEMLARLRPQAPPAVAVQIVGDDGSHATVWAVCHECLARMGHSGG